MRFAAFLALAAAACSSDRPAPAALPPVPPAPPAVAVDVAVYGDCRSGHDVHRRICASIRRAGAKTVVISGDLVDWGDDEDDWKAFRDVTRELRAEALFLPSVGNHDDSPAGHFRREFALDRLYYDRRVGDVHFFLLDSNEYFDDEAQLRWLEERAAASDARHKIASFHHPPFGIDTFYGFEAVRVRERIHALLARLKFCAALCGHHHSFYTTLRDGVRYVVTAGGGAPLYNQDPAKAQPGDLFRKFHHWVGLNVAPAGIRARVFDPDGAEDPALAFPLCSHR